MKLTPESKFMIFCGRLVELTAINLLWLVSSLPLVTIGASTTAMLSCLYAFRAGEPCGAKVFWNAFRRCFGRATVLWLVMAFLAAMLWLDYRLLAGLVFPGRMLAIALVCFAAFALVFFGGIIFPLLAQFPGSIRDMVINGVLLSLARLPTMLLVTGMNLLPLLVAVLLPRLFVFTGFLWVICGCALVGLYDITVMEKIFAPFREQEEICDGTAVP